MTTEWVKQVTACVRCGKHPGSHVLTVDGVRGYCVPCGEAAEWVEDAALGVAARDTPGGVLQVKPLTTDGAQRIYDASVASEPRNPARACLLPGVVGAIAYIQPAHRLAFARALSPIAGPGKRDSDAAWVMYMGLVGADGDNLLAECLALAGSAVLA